MEFVIRDELGRAEIDLTTSTTKVLGSITVNQSGTHHIPELVGRRAWALVRGWSWQAESRPNICSAEVDESGNIEVLLSYGTYQILYGIY